MGVFHTVWLEREKKKLLLLFLGGERKCGWHFGISMLILFVLFEGLFFSFLFFLFLWCVSCSLMEDSVWCFCWLVKMSKGGGRHWALDFMERGRKSPHALYEGHRLCELCRQHLKYNNGTSSDRSFMAINFCWFIFCIIRGSWRWTYSLYIFFFFWWMYSLTLHLCTLYKLFNVLIILY